MTQIAITLRRPTIHLNGTSRDDLEEQFADMRYQLEQAIKSLRSAYPNGRDYYPQGPEATLEVGAQHDDRIRRIESVLAEIAEIQESIFA